MREQWTFEHMNDNFATNPKRNQTRISERKFCGSAKKLKQREIQLKAEKTMKVAKHMGYKFTMNMGNSIWHMDIIHK